MEMCARCHAEVVDRYLGHGMSRAIGPAGAVTPGVVFNAGSGARYELTSSGDGGLLTARSADGGVRRQRIVGRIGAGIFDTSWVGAEIDPETGRTTDRLFFAPVEAITGRGLELSPFELHAPSAGVDLGLTRECVTCHTLTEPGALPRAGVAVGGTGDRRLPFPANHLGSDGFAHLSGLSCAACHGDTVRHVEVVTRKVTARDGDLGLARIKALPPAEQRDICARCHLQGEARVDLVDGRVRPGVPLGAQIPVVVTRARSADFRFVGQLERLELAACFTRSPAMTCTTCHQPHTSVAEQGTASFDRACTVCHDADPRHTALTVLDVTGHEARTALGCVDCHVRRSQPFDLPHVRSADHFVRRRIERPEDDIPHRQFADLAGAVAIHDDGRLAPELETPAGRKWEAGVLGMALVTMARFDEARRRLSAFPPPGTPAARTPSAPDGFAPLETHAGFHTLRGMLLMSTGDIAGATAALSDAVIVDPPAPHARLTLARLSLGVGDLPRAMRETQAVIDAYPHAEAPWDLRVEIAERLGRSDLALSALDASTRLWPSNPHAWMKLGLLLERANADRARRAFSRARAISPSAADALSRRAPIDR